MPSVVVLGDPVGDLLVGADQRRAGAAADQPDAGPQVGRHLERVGAAVVQRDHPRWPSDCDARWIACGSPICSGRGRRSSRSASAQASLGGVARDRVQADPEAQLAGPRARRARAPVELLGHRSGGSPQVR